MNNLFNLIYNKVYFDKYKYEKIDFDNMLRFFIIFFYTDCIIYFHIKAISLQSPQGDGLICLIVWAKIHLSSFDVQFYAGLYYVDYHLVTSCCFQDVFLLQALARDGRLAPKWVRLAPNGTNQVVNHREKKFFFRYYLSSAVCVCVCFRIVHNPAFLIPLVEKKR